VTTEMGPRDDDELTVSERAAGRMMDYIVRAFDHSIDDGAIRFNPETATLSLSGESERPGDRFSRGKIVAALCMGTALLSMMPLFFVAELMAVGNPYLAALGCLLTAVCGVSAIFITSGATDLINKVTVYDHTTEPAPDALDDIQQQYVDGEIDEEQLGERTAEVWER